MINKNSKWINFNGRGIMWEYEQHNIVNSIAIISPFSGGNNIIKTSKVFSINNGYI